tara:strand:- start:167 stop:415 length:249 start_codon:yes stop_codon:yes gene_type:complete
MNNNKLKKICIDIFSDEEQDSYRETKQVYLREVAHKLHSASSLLRWRDHEETPTSASLKKLIEESFDDLVIKQNKLKNSKEY